MVNLEKQSNIGHCLSDKTLTQLISDEVQPLVPDLKIDTLSYNSELFGILGTNNTVLTGDKVPHKDEHLVAKFGAGACLV